MEVWNAIKGWLGGGISALVYIAIVILFLVGVFKCLLPVSNNRKRLQKAIAQIKQGDKAKRSWQEDRFLGKGNLMPHWSEYLNNLFFANGEYHNPANVEDYINEETVIEAPGNAKLSEALPGIQVSLGFLGTLLGLSVALSEMNAVNAATITASMDTLLSSMKYAFLTSIFGVVASVSFTLFTRGLHARTERTLTDFYNAMARYAGVLSVDPMTQVAIYQQEQTGILKQLAQTLSPENFSRMLSPVTKATDMSCSAQQKLMDDVASAYVEKMNSAMNGQLTALGNAISETCVAQEQMMAKVTAAMSGFGDAAKAMSRLKDDAQTLLSGMSDAIREMRELMSGYTELNNNLADASSLQADTTRELGKVTKELSSQVSTVQEATGSYMGATQRLTDAAARSMTEAAGALTDSAKELSGVMSDAREKLRADMGESLAYFESCVTQVIKRIEKASKALDKAADSVSQAAGKGKR